MSDEDIFAEFPHLDATELALLQQQVNAFYRMVLDGGRIISGSPTPLMLRPVGENPKDE